MISILKKLIPKPLFRLYHYLLAIAANFFYGSPSDKLIVIGVTGTSGKSTTVYLITKILEKAGYRVGCSSTIIFKIDKREWLNDKKMTMIGRFALQRLIKRMVKANCQYAVIETTSQGIEQYRHWGINYDLLVFTNLYPEHIEAHGSFDNYKRAKLKLFEKLEKENPKILAGQKIKKTIIANLDDDHAPDFLNCWAEERFAFTLKNNTTELARVIRVENSRMTATGIDFDIEAQPFSLGLFGEHNIYNATAAVTVGLTQDLSLDSMAAGLANLPPIPGHFEFIEAGQNFKVLVDYAFEPKAVLALYENVKIIPHQKIIHLLGSTGGGRDTARRPVLGEIAGSRADYVIITNEDPYDEDPEQIISQVAEGARKKGKKINQALFKISDRRAGIAKALSLASANDIVLITGKGCEQAMAVAGRKLIPWDDRVVAREELAKISRR